MRSKYDVPVELKELDELLGLNNEEVIWQQKVKSNWSIFNLIFEMLIAGYFIFYFQDVFNILLSLAILIPSLALFYIANTMKYYILPNSIKFKWGFGNSMSIPFSDITAINLVKYTDSEYSTIFYGTKKKYKIKKMNFDENESRPHITFENVKEGDKVFELLNLLWSRNKIN